MSYIQEWEAQKKKALIAICTLGLSELKWEKLFHNTKDADKGLSFEGGFCGFLFKCFWFMLLASICAIIEWIKNIYKYIDYSYSISRYKKEQQQ